MSSTGQNKNVTHSRRSFIRLVAGSSALVTTATGASSAQSSTERVNWKFTIEDEWRIRTAPTIVNGIVYFGYGGGTVYAVDAATGEEVWRYETSGSVRSTPQVVGGTVYVGSSDNNLYALDANSGDEVWTFSTGETSNRTGVVSSPTVSNGTVFVGNRFERGTGPDTGVYAIDATTGTEEWSYETLATVEASPLVVDGTVIVGGQDDPVYALDEKTGEEIWSYATSGGVSSPTYSQNRVFVGSRDGTIHPLEISSGEQAWTFTSDSESGFVGSKVAPTVKDGSVFVGMTDGSLYSIKETDGTQNWKYTATNDSFYSSPTIAGGAIFIRGDGEALYVINSDGSEKWTFNIPGERPKSALRSPSSPTVVNGDVYFGGGNTLFSLSSNSGKSSGGSRVNYGVLGHHNVWAIKASEDDNQPPQDSPEVPSELDGEITTEQYTAVLDGDDELNAGSLSSAVNQWATTGAVNGVNIGAGELSALVNYWAA